METREKIELPKLFLEKMEQLLKDEFLIFIRSYDKERHYGLRLNPLKTAGEPAEWIQGLKKIPWSEGAYYYAPSLRPGKHPYHETGLYYIQEPSAMAVTEALNPKPGERLLDLCGAPGGKTTHIAGKMDGRGLLVSNEIHPARARILSRNVERMGIKNAVVTNEEPKRLVPYFTGFFDGIVVDAPCSGEGMFRKDENARLEWSPDHVKLCAERQDQIMDCAAAMLRPGGRIVYSTCTFSPEENEGTVARFLERHRDFSVEKSPCAHWFSCGRPEWADGGEYLENTVRIWPHQSEGEGHFLALLVKMGGAQKEINDRKNKDRREIPGLEDYLKFCRESLRIQNTGNQDTGQEAGGRLLVFGENLYLLPEEMPSFEGMKVLRPGLHLGVLKKGRFEPSHALALSLKKEEAILTVEVGGEAVAKRYLRGEAISITDTECGTKDQAPPLKGWTLITTGGYSLGWAKASAGILKNHYPKGLRQT